MIGKKLYIHIKEDSDTDDEYSQEQIRQEAKKPKFPFALVRQNAIKGFVVSAKAQEALRKNRELKTTNTTTATTTKTTPTPTQTTPTTTHTTTTTTQTATLI